MSAPTLFIIAADLTKMQVNANIDESDVGRMRPGQAVTFRVDAYPTDTFTGTVEQVRLQPDDGPERRHLLRPSSTCRIRQLKLKPGMTANVNIEIARKTTCCACRTRPSRFRPTTDIFDALNQDDAARARGGFGGRNAGGRGGGGRGGNGFGQPGGAIPAARRPAASGGQRGERIGNAADRDRGARSRGGFGRSEGRRRPVDAAGGGASNPGRAANAGSASASAANSGGGAPAGAAGGGPAVQSGPGGPGGFGGGRGFDPNMTPEERRKRMEERMAAMTPEERAAFQERMAARQNGQGGGRGGFGGFGGGQPNGAPGAPNAAANSGASGQAPAPAAASGQAAPARGGQGRVASVPSITIGATTIDSLFGAAPDGRNAGPRVALRQQAAETDVTCASVSPTARTPR